MRRTAFTLIEFLVVIAVLALLMAIVLSAVQPARQHAKTVVCGSNLRQLCLALTTYDQENGTFPHGLVDLTPGMVPPPGGYAGNAIYDNVGWWWFDFLAYIRGKNRDNDTVLWCPAKNITAPWPSANILCGNYGVNRAICKDAVSMGSEFVGKPLALYQIRSSAETLLITDSGYSLISWRGATDAPGQPFENPSREGSFYVPGLGINKARIIFPGHEEDAIYGRHPSKTVNVGFVDSHIRRVKADDLFVEEIGGDYTNRLPLWLPKTKKYR